MFWPLLLLQAAPVPQVTTHFPPVQPPARVPVPIGNPGAWIQSADYPANSLANLEEGITSFDLTINPAGTVQACRITGSSGYALLDEATCRILKERARFHPARDSRGSGVEGRYASRIRWVLPLQHLPLPQRQAMVLSFIVEPDGTRSQCRVEYAQKPTGLGGIRGDVPCGPGRFAEPYRDAEGKAVRRRITRTVVTTIEDVKPPSTDADAAPPEKAGEKPAEKPAAPQR